MQPQTTEVQKMQESEGFKEMEALDEDQITKEMQGHVISQYVYDVQGKLGLSWAGVKSVAERMKNQGQPISVEHVEIFQSEDGATFRAIAVAKNLASGEKRTGACEQKRFYDREQTKEVLFAYVLAGSKAQRNAIRHFIPETAIIAAVEEWKKNREKLPTK